MPYRRKYRKRTKRNPRKFNQMVQKVINKNVETKERAYTYDGNTITDSGRGGWKIKLTAIDQGDTQTDRIGNVIRVTGFHSEFIYKAGDGSNVVRFLLLIPRNVNDAPNPTAYSLLDLDRYTVLHDEKIPLVSGTSKDAVRRVVKRNFTRGGKTAGILVRYKGISNLDIVQHQIYAIWMSDSTAIPDPTMSGTMRLYFKDA